MENKSNQENQETPKDIHDNTEIPTIIEEYEIEELSVDGICGVY